MAKKDNPKKSKNTMPKAAPQSVDLSVGGNVERSVVIDGNNNVVNYYAAVSSNTEKHEPDYWDLKHPYPMPPNFTGRIAERALLTRWLNDDSENRLFILRALGGFGKSALTWQWLTHDVDIKEYPKVVFWSFYEGDASFEHFIEETLKYLKLEVPQGQRPQVDELLKAMQGEKILLIMDGFERTLRAYSSMNAAYQGDEEPILEDNQLDCVNINTEIFLKSICSLPSMKSKVLMTTRLTPRAVKPRGEFMLGCHEEELKAMQKEDAVAFFRAQGVSGMHTEIESACEPYGYHPLSLRILAGLILKDFDKPGDILVAQKFKIDGDLIAHQHHILEVSYNSLPPHEQKLLSTIACFRSSVELNTLKAIADRRNSLNSELHDLVERGLLHFDEKKKIFDLHPIVQRYAYERLTTSDRVTNHKRLINYFEAIPASSKAQKLDDLAPVIELYHHTIRVKKLDKAIDIYMDKLGIPLYFQFGAFHIAVELLKALFPDGDEKQLPQLKKEDTQVYTLNELANLYSMIGQPRRAVLLYEMANDIDEKRGDKEGLAVGLGSMASVAMLPIGFLQIAENNYLHSIRLCQEIGSDFEKATDYSRLGLLLAFHGAWDDSQENLILAQSFFDTLGAGKTNFVSFNWANRSQRANLMARLGQFESENIKSAIEYANHALETAQEHAQQNRPYERDFVRSHWLLGSAYRAASQLNFAEQHLSEAIIRVRTSKLVYFESDILLDLARLRYDQKKYEEAKSLAEEALSITERCGYVLQGADVNLFLAQYALEQEQNKAKAKEYAEIALKLATCDGPPYYYKVAYEEAERMLERLALSPSKG